MVIFSVHYLELDTYSIVVICFLLSLLLLYLHSGQSARFSGVDIESGNNLRSNYSMALLFAFFLSLSLLFFFFFFFLNTYSVSESILCHWAYNKRE